MWLCVNLRQCSLHTYRTSSHLCCLHNRSSRRSAQMDLHSVCCHNGTAPGKLRDSETTLTCSSCWHRLVLINSFHLRPDCCYNSEWPIFASTIFMSLLTVRRLKDLISGAKTSVYLRRIRFEHNRHLVTADWNHGIGRLLPTQCAAKKQTDMCVWNIQLNDYKH